MVDGLRRGKDGGCALGISGGQCLWTGTTWWESQPDGRLHIELLGREQGVVFLIITSGGNRILLDPGREATDYPLDAILDSLPGGKRPLDLVIPTRQEAGRPQGSAPTDPRPPSWLDQLPDALTVLPAPYPGTGAWPHPDLLARVQPQIILQPEGTTYPPAVQAILAETANVSRISNDAIVEIISDGQTFNLLVRPYSADVMQL